MFWIEQITFWVSGIVFTRVIERREEGKRRIPGFMVLILAIAAGRLALGAEVAIWIDALFLAASCAFMVLVLHSLWDIALPVAFYNMAWGVSVWHVTGELGRGTALIVKQYTDAVFAEALIMVLVYAVSYAGFGLTIAKWMPTGRKKKMGPRQIVLTLLIFWVINVLAFDEALWKMVAIDNEWKHLFLAQVLCIILLYLEGEMFKKSVLRQELELANLLYKKEQEHYLLAKENISLINQKCHDLKHQINALRKASREEMDTYLAEIENSIQIYEAIVKTGNEVFDTILTEKSLYCKDRQIQVSCVADGSQMEFIDAIDLYALLGNAMDNAIEAVEKFKEPEKRQIDVIIYRQQNFLVINIMNPISEELTYKEGLPVTTKEDKNFHGFGLRSMKSIIKKYEGFMSVNVEDGCFSLKFLIPIP